VAPVAIGDMEVLHDCEREALFVISEESSHDRSGLRLGSLDDSQEAGVCDDDCRSDSSREAGVAFVELVCEDASTCESLQEGSELNAFGFFSKVPCATKQPKSLSCHFSLKTAVAGGDAAGDCGVAEYAIDELADCDGFGSIDAFPARSELCSRDDVKAHDCVRNAEMDRREGDSMVGSAQCGHFLALDHGGVVAFEADIVSVEDVEQVTIAKEDHDDRCHVDSVPTFVATGQERSSCGNVDSVALGLAATAACLQSVLRHHGSRVGLGSIISYISFPLVLY
jgi:hypothetical protein